MSQGHSPAGARRALAGFLIALLPSARPSPLSRKQDTERRALFQRSCLWLAIHATAQREDGRIADAAAVVAASARPDAVSKAVTKAMVAAAMAANKLYDPLLTARLLSLPAKLPLTT